MTAAAALVMMAAAATAAAATAAGARVIDNGQLSGNQHIGGGVRVSTMDRSRVYDNTYGGRLGRLAEDFRRVHFKKGRNRILARVENGHWNCGWSLCISVEDAKTEL